jgi:flagellar biosynthesis/type III secretory pathway M-ring protein FliF/YscJ
MVATVVVVAALFALVLAVFIVAAFRYIDRQAERAHERQLAREERDYETIMEYAEEDSMRARESSVDDGTGRESGREPDRE